MTARAPRRGLTLAMSMSMSMSISMALSPGSASAAGASPLKLPDRGPPAEGRQSVRRLEASPSGLLLVVRLGGHPYRYDLLDRDGRVIWQAEDACCGGAPPWDVLLSPTTAAAVVRYPDGRPRDEYKLLLPGRPPQTLVQFSGGAFAADGSWFGGAMGSYSEGGTAWSVGVPRGRRVLDGLFGPGPRPDTLRYIDGNRRYVWNGRGAPESDGLWACAARVPERNLDGPAVAPVRQSADGRFVAWAQRGSTDLIFVCDGRGGPGSREVALGEVSSYAWADERELYYIKEGAVQRRSFPEGAAQPVPVKLPAGVLPSAVAVAGGWVLVGTDSGDVYRQPR